MTNSEFYPKDLYVLDDYISHIKVDSITMSYYAGVAANVGIILIECSDNYVPPKEFLFILRLTLFLTRLPTSPPLKKLTATSTGPLESYPLDLNPTLSDTVNTLRHQGYNTYE